MMPVAFRGVMLLAGSYHEEKRRNVAALMHPHATGAFSWYCMRGMHCMNRPR